MTRIDHQSGSDRIAEAVELTKLQNVTIINLQGDEPEIPINVVLDFAEFIKGITDFSMATLAYPLTHPESIKNPNLVKVVKGCKHNALIFLTRTHSI